MSEHLDAEAGQAVYSKPVLLIYDLWVLGFSNSFLWKCPTKLLRSEFSQQASLNHLDIGVGTGYYLEKCLAEQNRRLALMDLNPNSLDVAATRVNHFNPETYQANVLEDLTVQCEKFDSVSLNFLLHCLPGTIQQKSVVFKNILPLLKDEAVVFGSTILGDRNNVSFFAKKLMAVYNKKGIFDNSKDTLADLTSALNSYFTDVEIKVIGCVAVFSARYRRSVD